MSLIELYNKNNNINFNLDVGQDVEYYGHRCKILSINNCSKDMYCHFNCMSNGVTITLVTPRKAIKTICYSDLH